MGRKTKKSCLGIVLRLTAAAVLLSVLVGGAVAFWLYRDYSEFQQTLLLEEGERATLEIPPGTSWPGVVERVSAAGLVEWDVHFNIWGRQTGLAEASRAGNFYLEGPLDLEELSELLRRGGRAEEVTVTFREGLTIFDLADVFEEAGLGERADFMEVASDPSRYEWAQERKETLEGYLYPETYRFSTGVSAGHVVDRLVEQWHREIEPLFEEHAQAVEMLEERYDMDRHDVIIMASLIERETSVDIERDLIARVFYNRLDRGMQLQTDPTCVYGESTYGQVPTRDACRDPLNRYSTYVIEGLPPGPIANPSVSSVEAALNPSTDPEAMEYLFFVSRRDGTGEHYFSVTYAEHREAIQRYLINR